MDQNKPNKDERAGRSRGHATGNKKSNDQDPDLPGFGDLNSQDSGPSDRGNRHGSKEQKKPAKKRTTKPSSSAAAGSSGDSTQGITATDVNSRMSQDQTSDSTLAFQQHLGLNSPLNRSDGGSTTSQNPISTLDPDSAISLQPTKIPFMRMQDHPIYKAYMPDPQAMPPPNFNSMGENRSSLFSQGQNQSRTQPSFDITSAPRQNSENVGQTAGTQDRPYLQSDFLPTFNGMGENRSSLFSQGQNQSRTQQFSPDNTSSPRPGIRQPIQNSMTATPDIPPPSATMSFFPASSSTRPASSVFKKPALPIRANPTPQSFYSITSINTTLRELSSLSKAEVVLLETQPCLGSPGLASRQTRLLIIHAQARAAGCDYFLNELQKRFPQPLQPILNYSDNPLPRYGFSLSVNLMQLGVVTSDLNTFIVEQLVTTRKELATRIKNAESAAKNVKGPREREMADVCRAWNIEVAEWAARVYFLQCCAEGLGKKFVNWEDMAAREEEELQLEVVEEVDADAFWDDCPVPSVEGSGYEHVLL